MFGVLLDEAKKIIRQPARLGQALRPRRWRQFFSVLIFQARTGNRWKPAPGADHLKHREYSSYDEYVRHQQSKFAYLDLTEYDHAYREQLRERLQSRAFLKPGVNVLCLGARQGTEVKAFRDLGCFAVGIDLNPGRDNPWVLPGDFHDVQFPSASVDVLFTNSFDHAFDPEKLLREISRLLKSNGVLIVEAIRGEAENSSADYYASLWWEKIDDLVALFAKRGFALIERAAFTQPWPGEQLLFRHPPTS